MGVGYSIGTHRMLLNSSHFSDSQLFEPSKRAELKPDINKIRHKWTPKFETEAAAQSDCPQVPVLEILEEDVVKLLTNILATEDTRLACAT